MQNESKIKMRLDWVVASRALAMIFVYMGHWSTPRVTAFAYGKVKIG